MINNLRNNLKDEEIQNFLDKFSIKEIKEIVRVKGKR